MITTNGQILAAVNAANKKLDTALSQIGTIMSQQDDITADVQVISQAVTDLGTAATAIEAEIASLKTTNPALDLAPLDAAVGSLKTAVSGVTAIAPPPAAAPAPPAS